MAKLILKTGGASVRALELKWGLNRLGRAADNDFKIEHPTISTHHCELTLGLDSVAVRDCGSTNGTGIDGRRVGEGTLHHGQTLRLGDLEMVLEMVAANVSVPKIEVPKPPASVVLADGSLSCLRHPETPAVWQCLQCHAMSCAECIHHLHRPGGIHFFFCPVCSGRCERIGPREERKKKNVVLAFLEKALNLGSKKESGEKK